MRGDNQMEYCYIKPKDDELYHHGVKGQRWGIRRYQNPDGTLTEKGKAKLSKYKNKQINRVTKAYNKVDKRLEKYARKLDNKRNKRIMRLQSTTNIDKNLSNTSLNRNINTAAMKAAVTKAKNMKLSDIPSAKRQRAAFLAKSGLKKVGAVGLGAATGFGISFGAALLGLSEGAAIGGGAGWATGFAINNIKLHKKFTNLTKSEQLAIYKKFQKKGQNKK